MHPYQQMCYDLYLESKYRNRVKFFSNISPHKSNVKGAEEMIERRTLGLEEARNIIEVMLEEAAKEPGGPCSFAVVDIAGVLIYFAKMDGASPHTARVSINKAYTAIDVGRDTSEYQTRLRERGYDSVWFGEPRMTAIPGGVLVKAGDGAIIGAIGACGRQSAVDEELARIGANSVHI